MMGHHGSVSDVAPWSFTVAASTMDRDFLSNIFLGNKQQIKMSRNFDMIGTIDDSKETFKLAVRIVDIWFVQPREKSRHLEMVLMDGKGDKIHTIVKKEDLDSWESDLKEEKTYYMYNFRAVPNDGQYKVCGHPFKLFFTGGTTLRQVDLPDIPLKSYKFKSFDEIANGKYDPDILIDIIGVVEEIKFQLPNANPAKAVFSLKDLSGQVIGCTLWSEHATKFMVWLQENVALLPMIIVLTQAKVKLPQGVHGLTISNSLYGSKLLINDEVPDFQIYKERLKPSCLGESSNLSQSISLGQHSSASQFSEIERFLYKSKVLSLSDVCDVGDGTNFCTVGTTAKLIAAKGGWFYNSCSRCTKKADHDDVTYTCSCGKLNERSMPRYRVEIMVCHKKTSSNFVFWDRECTDIIGTSAGDLRKLMIQAGEGGPKHFPDPLDKMLGLTLALRCKYQEKFNTSSVMKISDDPDIIKAISEQIDAPQGDVHEIAKPTCHKPEDDVDEIPKTTCDKPEGDVDQIGKPICDKLEASDQGLSQNPKTTCDKPEGDVDEIGKPICDKLEASDQGLSQNQDLSQDDASLSVTADYDPDQDTILTPKKRSYSELAADYPLSEEAPPVQLSATKLAKHINNE